jgi:hypothetical protein
MDDDEGSELFGLGPEGSERRVGQFPPRDIREHLRSFQSEMAHPPFKLGCRFTAVRHRHAAECDEAIRLARDIFRDAVIHDLRGFNADVDWHRVVALRGRRHDDLKVDPHLVEIAKTPG